MPNPLSQTQTRQMHEYVETYVAAEIRRQLRPWKIYTVAIVVGLVVGALVGAWAYSSTFSYARTVSCQRGQAVSIALRQVVQAAIPRHRKGRTQAEAQEVAAFYRKVAPALKVPTCN